MGISYKQRKEDFVSNLHGIDIPFLSFIVSVLPLAYCITIACNILYERMGARSLMVRSIIECLIICAASLLAVSVTEASTLFYTSLAISIGSWLLLRVWASNQRAARNDAPTGTVGLDLLRSAVSAYRGSIMLLTSLAILAVDFPFFLRLHAKTEAYGASMMDLGVGAVVTASAMTSRAARASSSVSTSGKISKRGSLWSSMASSLAKIAIPCLLGVVRVFAHRAVEYQHHVSEYGLHWNFYWTIAVIMVTMALLEALGEAGAWVTDVVLGLVGADRGVESRAAVRKGRASTQGTAAGRTRSSGKGRAGSKSRGRAAAGTSQQPAEDVEGSALSSVLQSSDPSVTAAISAWRQAGLYALCGTALALAYQALLRAPCDTSAPGVCRSLFGPVEAMDRCMDSLVVPPSSTYVLRQSAPSSFTAAASVTAHGGMPIAAARAALPITVDDGDRLHHVPFLAPPGSLESLLLCAPRAAGPTETTGVEGVNAATAGASAVYSSLSWFILANREGLFSSVGYLALHLFGLAAGKALVGLRAASGLDVDAGGAGADGRTGTHLQAQQRALARLTIASVFIGSVLWFTYALLSDPWWLTVLDNGLLQPKATLMLRAMVSPPSRRLANASYIALSLAMNATQMAVYAGTGWLAASAAIREAAATAAEEQQRAQTEAMDTADKASITAPATPAPSVASSRGRMSAGGLSQGRLSQASSTLLASPPTAKSPRVSTATKSSRSSRSTGRRASVASKARSSRVRLPGSGGRGRRPSALKSVQADSLVAQGSEVPAGHGSDSIAAQATNSPAVPPPYVSLLLESVNASFFPFFVLANLLTGIVNGTMWTLDTPNAGAVVVLGAYMTVLCGAAIARHVTK